MKPYYEKNGIEIYHADARDVLPDLKADLLLTDPPYGIGAANRSFGGGAGVKRHMTGLLRGKKAVPKRDYGHATWDDKPVADDLLMLAQGCCPHQIIFGGNYFNLGPARCFLVWDKLRGNTDYADAELAWTNFNRTVRVIRWKWNGFLQQVKEERHHPTQKPVGVMAWAIEQAPKECASILDPFMGAGSALVAARDLGRRAIGIELEERYCEITARRLEETALALAA